MATVNYDNPPTLVNYAGHEAHVYKYEGLGNADSGQAIEVPVGQKSVQVGGTFGGATCVLEGSNDGVSYFTLNDLGDSALSFTSAGLQGIQETVRYIRPTTSGGTGTDLDVHILVRRQGSQK